MNQGAKYFRIGLFVISALLILLLGAFALGARSWFEPTLRFETYFDDTIAGINIGSPVKFRGVPMGRVTRIDFTPNVYPQPELAANPSVRYRYILVEFEIKQALLAGLLQDNFQENLNAAISQGLRIRVDMAGIAGGNYLEMDRTDPLLASPPLEKNWTPRYYYIPSTKSQITQIVNSLNQTLQQLGKIDFDEIQKKIIVLLGQFEKNSTQVDDLLNRLNHMNLPGIVDNVRIITEEVRDSAGMLKDYPSQILWGDPPPPAKSVKPNPGP
jgi:paraquat-inducible protein B